MGDSMSPEGGGAGRTGRKTSSSNKRRRAPVSSEDDEDTEEEEQASDSEQESDDENRRGKEATTPKGGSSMPLKKRMALQEDEDEDDEEDFEAFIQQELGYGPDLYIDKKDKERLGAMTEFQRELLLAERAEKRDELTQQREIRVQQRQRQEAEGGKSAQKHKASRERSRAPVRVQRDRGKEQKTKASALEELMALREKKGLATHKAAAKKKGRREGDEDDDDDEEMSGEGEEEEEEEQDEEAVDASASESEDEYAKRRRAMGQGRQQGSDDEEEEAEDEAFQAADLKAVLTATLPRARLERWHQEPFFSDTIAGCYMRVICGSGPAGPVYRMAEAVRVISGQHENRTLPPYEFPTASGKQTHKFLLLQIGTAQKPFRMDVVSNQVITEAEFSRWTKTLHQEGIPLPSKSEIDELKSKLDRANDFRYTAAEVKTILDEKRRTGSLAQGATSREKTRLMVRREQAIEAGEPTAELDAQIQEVIGRLAVASAAKGGEMRANLNKLNRANNTKVRFEESRKKLKTDIEGTADFTNDRFSRRPTHLNNYWSTAATVAATAAAAMEEKEKPVEKKEEEEKEEVNSEDEELGEELRAKKATLSHTQAVGNIAEAHLAVQLAVDLTLLPARGKQQHNRAPGRWRLPPAPTEFTLPPQPHNIILSLMDYKRRQGLV